MAFFCCEVMGMTCLTKAKGSQALNKANNVNFYSGYSNGIVPGWRDNFLRGCPYC